MRLLFFWLKVDRPKATTICFARPLQYFLGKTVAPVSQYVVSFGALLKLNKRLQPAIHERTIMGVKIHDVLT